MISHFARLSAVLALLLGASGGLPAAEPVTPNATAEAKKILAYLSQLPGRYDRRVVSGQHVPQGEDIDGRFAAAVGRLQRESGKWVAMIGMDHGSAANAQAPAANRAKTNRILTDYWKLGGLVMISFQPANPWTGGSARDTNARDLEELTTAGTAANAAWMKELDGLAESLVQLRDAGVVVLWRPFHEMNGDWFWWGRLDKQQFRKEGFTRLWRQMFEYFTVTKKLNNLLWVYSASSGAHRETSASAYFPGKEYCDIVGMDCLSNEIVWDGYNEMVQLGKPFGITTLGPSRDEPVSLDYGQVGERIRLWYPLSSFFLAAGEAGSLVNSRNAGALLNDPWVVSRDDLGWAVPGYRRWKQAGALAIRKVEVLSKSVACWRRVDIAVDLTAAYDTPFDSAQIEVDGLFATPSGKTMTVPAFFYQPFERQVWGGNRSSEEAMAEAGPGEWRIRFMPAEPGQYRFRIRARDRTGSLESPVAAFTASAGAGSGYIRVSRRDPHYFEFDDGTPFFAIGLNIVEHPLSDYYRYIPRLAQSGGNFSRLWIGFDYFALEHGAPGEYRLDNAWRLDQVMELSEQHGIYQKLCIDWVRYLPAPGEPSRGFQRADYAYGIGNGGPCRTMRDFFTLPEARRLFKNRLRYLVARWGYSPNVMAWELWNEIDLVDPKAGGAEVIVPWNQEMGRYLKSVDPWQHLTTNSLGGRGMAKALWTLGENEFAQRHGYNTPRPQAVLASADMAGSVIQWLDDVAGYDKPYLMAEFGLQRDRMEVRALCDRDQEGVHMHNGIWAALAHGAAGTAQLWWWGQYVDPKNLYYHFRAVADFVKGIPWTSAGFVKAEVQGADENLRVLGLRGKPVSILWLQNKAHTWWNVVSGSPIPALQPGEVTLPGFTPGRYRVEYWNTYEGRIEQTVRVTSSGGSLRLPIPALGKDIAVKILEDS